MRSLETPDGRADAKSAQPVLGRVGVLDRLLDVLDGDQSLEIARAVHDEELLDAVLVKKLLGLLERRADRGRHEMVLCHPGGDRAIRVRFEPQVAVRQDADELSFAVDHRDPRDLVAGHDFEGFRDLLLRPASDRVDDHAGLGPFDAVDLLGLSGDRQILVDHAQPALLGHRDGEARLRDGIHRGGNDRNVQRDVVRELRPQVHVARVDARVRREEQHVVECQGERNLGPGGRSLLGHYLLAGACPAPTGAAAGRVGPPSAPWHFLNFFPDPQGHGSLRPTFGASRWIVSTFASCPPDAAAP